MNLFDKRPLALILCIAVGGFVVFSFSDTLLRYILLISSATLGLFSLLFLRERRHKTVVSLLSAALLLAMLFSHIYFDLYFSAAERFSGEAEIEAVVGDIEYTDYSATLELHTHTINGEAADYRLIARIDKADTMELSVGSVISFTAALEEFNSDSKSYYFSQGFSARVSEIKELRVSSQGEIPIESRLATAREWLFRRAAMLSDYDTGAFAAALLLGERSYLDSKVNLDFKTIGISHILALSGMHLVMLTAGVGFLLSSLGVRKKPRVLITMCFTLAYMALTGFSASIMRAGIMLIISSLLFLLSSAHDSLTSLACSVAVILIITPYAIYDLSLWLSAIATLGIIVFAELKPSKRKTKNPAIRLLRFSLSSIIASVFAIAATLPITASFFGSLSPLSPIATLIFTVPIQIIMYIGSFMLIFGDIIPFGLLLTPLTRGTCALAGYIADIPGALASTDFIAVKIIIGILTAVFILFVFLKLRHKRAWVCTILALYTLVIGASVMLTAIAKSYDDVVYIREDSADAFIIKSNSEICLIDTSGYKTSVAYQWLDELSSRNIVALDKYVLTHYSRRLLTAVDLTLSKVPVNEICLPAPQNDGEAELLVSIRDIADKHNTTVTLTEIGDTLKVGRFEIREFYSTPYGEGTSRVGFSILANGKKHLYLSSGMYEGKTKSAATEEMETSYAIIFGSHGQKYSEQVYFDKRFPKTWMIILGSNNLYLTPSALEYYELSGGEVYHKPNKTSILR